MIRKILILKGSPRSNGNDVGTTLMDGTTYNAESETIQANLQQHEKLSQNRCSKWLKARAARSGE